MITWGINSSSHDSALAVFQNNKLLFASSSERFSKIKNDPNLDAGLINYALEYGYPQEIVLSEKNYLKNIRKFFFGGKIKDEINIAFPFQYDLNRVSHHESHAAFGYYTSTFDKCVICGKDTPYLISTHIDLRDGYLEGAGQGCYQEHICKNK